MSQSRQPSPSANGSILFSSLCRIVVLPLVILIIIVATYLSHQTRDNGINHFRNFDAPANPPPGMDAQAPEGLDGAILQKIVSALFPGGDRTQKDSNLFLALTNQLLDPLQPMKVHRRAAWQIVRRRQLP